MATSVKMGRSESLLRFLDESWQGNVKSARIVEKKSPKRPFNLLKRRLQGLLRAMVSKLQRQAVEHSRLLQTDLCLLAKVLQCK